MKFEANKYDAKDIMRIIREWTELTQEEFGESIGKRGRAWSRNIENGYTRVYFEDFLKIIKKYGITVTIEKKQYVKSLKS